MRFGLAIAVIFIALTAAGVMAQAEPATNIPMAFTQPDGATLNCFASGDEFYHHLHDANGYYIMQDPASGYYVYATTDAGGKLAASNLVAMNNALYYTRTAGGMAGAPRFGGNLAPFGGEFAGGLYGPAVFPAATSNIVITAEDVDLSVNSDLVWVPGTPPAPPAPEMEPDSEVGPVRATPVTGVMENVLILIAFSDQSPVITPQMATDVETMFNGPAPSLKNYTKTVSGGVFEINTTLTGLNDTTVLMYQSPYPRNYYEPYNAATNPIGHSNPSDPSSSRVIREHTVLRDAVNAINGSALLAGKNLDTTGNGKVDSVMFMFMGAAGTDITWAHKWNLYYYNVYLSGKLIDEYAVYAWDRIFGATKNLSTLCHETMHVFTFPDLYRYSGSPGSPVEMWDVMSNHPSNMQPQLPNTHTVRRYAGWGDPVPEITENGRYTLSPLGSQNGTTAYAIQTGGANQYIMLEYRNAANGSGYDQYYFTPTNSYYRAGLLVSRINTSFSGNANRYNQPTTDDELFYFRTGETTMRAANGSISTAALSTQASRTSFGNDTATTPWSNDMIYLYNGANTQYLISNVSAAGGTISFDVKIKPLVTRAVSFIAGSNGTISAIYNSAAFTSGNAVTAGSTVSFTATPVLNYIVDKWYVNGAEVAAGGNTYALTNIQNASTVEVTFKHDPTKVVADVLITTSPANVTGLPNNTPVTVTMTTTTTGASIYYTLNGNSPTTSSTLYAGPFTVTAGTVGATTKRVIAYAVKGSDVPSKRTYVDISFNADGAAPVLSYDLNGGPGTTPSNQTNPTNVTTAIPAMWMGYTFSGWADSNSAATPNYLPGAAISLAASKTIYAVWTPAATLSLNTPTAVAIDYNNKIVLFKYVPSVTGEHTLTSSSPGSRDPYGLLYNAAGTQLDYSDDDGGYPNFKLANNLTAGTTYYYGCRLYDDSNGLGSYTVTLTGPAKSAGAAVSGAPTLNSATSTTITVNAVTNAGTTGQTVEYAISTSATAPATGWQDTLTFSGLTPSTGYYVYARTKENTSYDAGASQRGGPFSTAASPAITATVTGLTGLKVGVPIAAGSAYVTYTLNTGNSYAASITAANFALSGLPAWLTASTAQRDASGTTVTVSLSGTPTAANASTVTLTRPTSVAAANVTGATAAVPVSGTVTLGAVAKGDGANVSGAPTQNSAASTTITVNAVTNAGTTGQAVEYAISTSTTAPASGWQSGTTFTTLAPSTTYYVFARTAENADYYAGAAQCSAAITTAGGAAITVTASMATLKVGQPMFGSVVFTLANGTYADPINPGDFTVSGLPPGLWPGSGMRTSNTEVTVSVTGTPTTASAAAVNLIVPSGIPAANVVGASALVPVGGTAAAGPVAKGDGADVSGAPTQNSVTASSVTVNAVTNAGTTGQTVEYAISTTTAVPAAGWQAGTTFTTLNPSTPYYVFARTAENANYYAGTAQCSVAITTTSGVTPSIAAAASGLSTLKVGQAVSGSVAFTLTNGTYADPVNTGDFTVGNLPPGLSVVSVVRTSGALVTVNITGTPTAANANTRNLTVPVTVAQANVTGAAAAVPVGGAVTAGAVDKGAGAAVSGAPTQNSVVAYSVTVNAVTNAGATGQSVEYAISTSGTVPVTGWQAGTTFTLLSPSTTYYVYARTAENANYYAGTAQCSVGITTAVATVTPALSGPARMDYRGSITLRSNVPIVQCWTTSMRSSARIQGDGTSITVSCDKQFKKIGMTEVYARTAGGEVLYFAIEIRPTFLQWLIIILLFGWIWY